MRRSHCHLTHPGLPLKSLLQSAFPLVVDVGDTQDADGELDLGDGRGQDLLVKVSDLCFVFCVLCFEFCVLCFVFCVLCFVFCVLCFGFWVLGFGFRV